MEPFTQASYPYTAVDLTQQIELIPNVWGRIEEMGLFGTPEGLTSKYVEIALVDGQVKILAATERGAAGPVGGSDAERSVVIAVPHFPYEEVIKPDDVQDRFAFGSRTQPRRVDEVTARKLLAIRRRHALTREWLRMGALKGNLYDGAGSLLLNLYSAFDITPKTVDLALGTSTTDILGKLDEVAVHMRLNLLGETMNGIHCLMARNLYRRIVTHPNVEKFYINWQNAAALAGAQNLFEFGGVVFEPYDAVSTGVDGQTKTFATSGEGYCFPLGTMETFRDYNAPPHHIAYANAVGPDVFVSPELLKHGAGIELKSQSNPLPVCARPALLVKIYSSN